MFLAVTYDPWTDGTDTLDRQQNPLEGFVVPGVGVDVVDCERMKFALERTPRIRKRLFTDSEIEYCEKYRFYERHYAGRWAAKEAVTKALGCGLIQWNGVEVMRQRRRAPTVRIFGKIKRFADAVGVREEDIHISITHSELSAVAVCTIRREQIAG
jgi:holo-[acyl-carrier protein] synthase